MTAQVGDSRNRLAAALRGEAGGPAGLHLDGLMGGLGDHGLLALRAGRGFLYVSGRLPYRRGRG
jgi:hypothetical protein